MQNHRSGGDCMALSTVSLSLGGDCVALGEGALYIPPPHLQPPTLVSPSLLLYSETIRMVSFYHRATNSTLYEMLFF